MERLVRHHAAVAERHAPAGAVMAVVGWVRVHSSREKQRFARTASPQRLRRGSLARAEERGELAVAMILAGVNAQPLTSTPKR